MQSHAYGPSGRASARDDLPTVDERIAQLERDNARLKRDNALLKEQDRCTRELLHNASIPPVARLLVLEGLWQAGAAPGRPAALRASEWTRTSIKSIAQRMGVSPRTAERFWPNIMDMGFVRYRTLKEVDDKGAWTSTSYIAPSEGENWLRTGAAPGQVRYGGQTQAHKTEATRQAAKRLACPECGSDDVGVVCRACGTITPADELPRAPRPVWRSRRHRTDNLSVPYNNHQFNEGNEETPDRQLVGPVDTVDPLTSAVAVLTPIVAGCECPVVMQPRKRDDDNKYLSLKRPLMVDDIRAHLQGCTTYGSSLCWPDIGVDSERGARAIAWDADHDIKPLVTAAIGLARRGLRPLIVRNPAKESSGHLWLLFDEPVDPTAAMAAVEHIAPELRDVPERFPDPTSPHGKRLRLPGGVYLPIGSAPVPVQVAEAPNGGAPTWVDGTTPEAWSIIAGSVSRAAILHATYVPLVARPKRPQPRRLMQKRPALRLVGGENPFERFNAAHSIDSLVEVGRDGTFKAPWRDERTASVHVYPDGHWHDFGPDQRHGKDAFDLWCAIEGHWDTGANRPDRRAALRALRTQKSP